MVLEDVDVNLVNAIIERGGCVKKLKHGAVDIHPSDTWYEPYFMKGEQLTTIDGQYEGMLTGDPIWMSVPLPSVDEVAGESLIFSDLSTI